MKKLTLGIIALIILLFFLVYAGIQQVAKWFDRNEIVFNQVIKVELKKPFDIVKREPVIKQVLLEYPGEIDSDIKRFICDTFGPYNCRIALAVASVEGLNHPPDGFNINTNGTIDVGYFRVNSIHFKKPGCSLSEVITEKGNVLCAYSIWKQQGNFSAWVGFTNGN